MLRPAAMLRVEAIVLERERRAVLWDLGRLGAVQLTQRPAGADSAPREPPDRAGEIAACDRLLGRIAELGRSLEVADLPGLALDPSPSLDRVEEALQGLEERAGDRLAGVRDRIRQRDEAAARCDEAAACADLALPLSRIRESDFLHFVTGSLPEGAFEPLAEALGPGAVLIPLASRDGRQGVAALASPRARADLDGAMRAAGFRPGTLPADPVPLAEAERRLDDATRDLQQAEDDRRALASEVAPVVASLQAAVQVERRMLVAEQCFPRTESTVLITGWLPAAEAPRVEMCLRERTGGRVLLRLEPPGDSPEADIPVLLRPSRWLRPFAMLVEAFGLPTYRELEPTLFVAVSYVLMFGMMFGDVGHGALLVAAGSVALARGRRWGGLLLGAGVSSMAFGAVYGSCFGITALKELALWRDPLEGDPMDLMVMAIGLGVAMNSLGLVLNVINRVRRGDVIGGVLDKFGAAGLLFYWGALALLLGYEAFADRGLVAWAVLGFLGVPILAWAAKGPLEIVLRRRAGHGHDDEGLLSSLAESVAGAFEAMFAYLANTVSFVRLAAYALSHAALLLATFLLAEELRGPAGGMTAGSVLVVIAGNAIAVVLEGLVASVQALRLEYYEFFGKFFSGDGRPFRPFRLTGS